jgi:hypothetical protein
LSLKDLAVLDGSRPLPLGDVNGLTLTSGGLLLYAIIATSAQSASLKLK